MEQNEVATFQRSIVECGDPVEIARKVKLAFKKMSGEMALACFAKVMTAELPHPIKVAMWDAVRYSHIWWGVDEVLKGDVMNNPIVQQAFADAVPMRRWIVEHRLQGWEFICMTYNSEFVTQGQVEGASTNKPERRLRLLIHLITHFPDIESAYLIRKNLSGPENAAAIANYIDWRGNNILWYLAYRDDQQAQGGFACPRIEHELLQLGVDPNHRNDIGLCWNDVRRHLIRTEL